MWDLRVSRSQTRLSFSTSGRRPRTNMRQQVKALATLIVVATVAPGTADAQPRGLTLTVDPNIGSASAPKVRIERVRRASADPKLPGDTKPRSPVDTGLINFEVLVKNTGP